MDSTTSSLVFMDLPNELLTYILSFLLVCNHNIRINCDPEPTFFCVPLTSEVLQVNRRLYDRGIIVVRGANTFEFLDDVPVALGIQVINQVLMPHLKKLDISHQWAKWARASLRELDGLDWVRVRFETRKLVCENNEELLECRQKHAKKLRHFVRPWDLGGGRKEEKVAMRTLRDYRERNPEMILLLAVEVRVKTPTTRVVPVDVSLLLCTTGSRD